MRSVKSFASDLYNLLDNLTSNIFKYILKDYYNFPLFKLHFSVYGVIVSKCNLSKNHLHAHGYHFNDALKYFCSNAKFLGKK